MKKTARFPELSVITPVYKEVRELEEFLDWWESVPGKENMELILCLAQSGERVSIPESAARVIRGLKPSRSRQMNAGARAAKGKYLFFLHIDSRPPLNFYELIRATLSVKKIIAGAFSHRFHESGKSFSLAVISWINRLRYFMTGLYYGDQGLFLSAEDFRLVGGFDDLPLLEDIYIIKKLKKRGRVVCLKDVAQTSGRRFLKNGPWKTFFMIWSILVKDALGFDLEKQAREYRRTK